MFSTQLRRDHIHGLLVGVAAGEALGYYYQGLSRREVLCRAGRAPLKYRLLPTVGLTASNTGLLFLAAQAVVTSGSDSKTFVDRFQRRLGWYPLSFPFSLDSSSLRAGLKSWLRLFKVSTGSPATDSAPVTRALFLALALNGTGSRLKRWTELSTTVTHSHPLTIDGCLVLSGVADLVAEHLEEFDPVDACEKLASMSKEAELRDRLALLPEFLKDLRSPRSVANHFGWDTGISGGIVPTTVMAAYCFLRNPLNFRKAVESAIRLGGDTSAMGAIVGGLCGANLGFKQLPDDLVQGLFDFAYGPTWINGLAIRMSHWPHGPNDLHAVHAEPTAIIELTITNFLRGLLVLFHRTSRLCLLRDIEKRSLRSRRTDCAAGT